jgi:hypothetical protein
MVKMFISDLVFDFIIAVLYLSMLWHLDNGFVRGSFLAITFQNVSGKVIV